MKSASRVAILGLDGVPFSLLQHLIKSGTVCTIGEMAASGSFLPMETVHPCVSSVAWTSFMTGQNPGEHGIFGFTDLKRGTVALALPSFDDIQSPVLWDCLPQRTSLVVNLPFTYPARPLNGILISGFVAPVLERSVYPQSLLGWLKSKNYRTDVDAVKGRQDRQFLMKDLFETLTIHSETMLNLMNDRKWDLFIGVITGTDRLHHFFFDACWDDGHPLHGEVLNYYRRIDSFVRDLRAAYGGETRFILLSDHGFTRLKTQVYLNHLLKTMGYLTFNIPTPRAIEDIHPSSRAFAMDPSRIYINARDRFSPGGVAPGDSRMVRNALKRDLQAVRLKDLGPGLDLGDDDPDDLLFTEVLVKEEAFRGKCVSMAPDLLLIPKPGYDLKATVQVQQLTMTDIFTGMHTHDDAFLMLNEPGLDTHLPSPRITDVFGLVMKVLG